MATFSETSTTLNLLLLLLLLLLTLPFFLSSTSPSALIDELNQPLPPDFPTTISNNCLRDASLRYCNSTATDLHNIFKSTIVAKHLCVASNNSQCDVSFPKIDLRSRPRLVPLYLSFAFFWKYCPPSILSIDLSNNSLNGPFPSHLLQCTQIHTLDLSHNALSGHLPVEPFLRLTNLSSLNLSCNHFSESGIEKIEFFRQFNSSSFLHSGLLAIDHRHWFTLRVTTAVLLLFGVSVLVVTAIGVFLCLLIHRPDYLPSLLRRSHKYTPGMLKAATEGFSEDNLLSRSERWEVYRGRVSGGVEVDVKVQKGRFLRASRHAFEEESRVLVRLEHKNLARVLGWCNQRKLRAMVILRVGVCSVEEWLLSSPPWKHRLKVLMGVTEGMCYLQEQWPLVRCGLHTASVMLSEELEPLISEFRVGSHNTEAKMVYKFGLFLLETITNKRPREDFKAGEAEFLDWIKMHFPDHCQVLIDEKVKLSSQSYCQMRQALEIGLACTRTTTRSLPSQSLLSISKVLRMLSGVCVHHKLHAERQQEQGKTRSVSFQY